LDAIYILVDRQLHEGVSLHDRRERVGDEDRGDDSRDADPDLSRARPHDLGGQPAGPIDRTEHEAEPWQNLVTALMYLLRDHCHLAKTDEMRRAIEDMKPEDYRRLGYFDKWAVGISTLVVEKGLMTSDEIRRRVGDLSARLGTKS
jgi:hypothetical protein